ncbi:MAG: hypothetical protein ACYTEK_15585 [Planctomycetota bacterium]
MKNDINDEKLEEMMTDLDPPYESREELKIGRLLDQYGIPFFYKQPTIVYEQGQNRIAKPSFTLLGYDQTWTSQTGMRTSTGSSSACLVNPLTRCGTHQRMPKGRNQGLKQLNFGPTEYSVVRSR